MGTVTRGALAVTAVAAVAVGLAACAEEEDDDAGGERTPSIGILMPESQTERWESSDLPLIERRIRELCRDCPLKSANASGNVAVQQQQVNAMIASGMDVIILVPVDGTAIQTAVEQADEAGVAVVSYDRLAEGPVSGYVSFDNVRVGTLQGQALLRALRERGEGHGPGGKPQIVVITTSALDPNAALFDRGARSVLAGQVDIARRYPAPIDPTRAFGTMAGAISDLGIDAIDGVYAFNDTAASGAIAALKAAGVDPVPPVTGQDADLVAIQRILTGDQYMTVYKPFEAEAGPAAEMAVALGRGEGVGRIATETVDSPTERDVPAVLAEPVPVTVGTIAETVVRGGLYTVDEICTPDYESACQRAGLTG